MNFEPQMNKINLPGPWLLVGAIFVVALTRWLPHPPNFSPVVAVALFGGAAFAERRLAFVVPLAAMLLSDLVIGFHNTMAFVYLGMSAVVLFGLLLGGSRRPLLLVVAGIAGSAVFFMISNIGVWWMSEVYAKSAEGLLLCLAAALPFFHNTLLATLIYGGVLVGCEFGLRKLQDGVTVSAS